MNLSDLTPMDRARMRNRALEIHRALEIPVGISSSVYMQIPRPVQVWSPNAVFDPPVVVALQLSSWHCRLHGRVQWASLRDEQPHPFCPWCPVFEQKWAESMRKFLFWLCDLAVEILKTRLAGYRKDAAATEDIFGKLEIAMQCMSPSWNP